MRILLFLLCTQLIACQIVLVLPKKGVDSQENGGAVKLNNYLLDCCTIILDSTNLSEYIEGRTSKRGANYSLRLPEKYIVESVWENEFSGMSSIDKNTKIIIKPKIIDLYYNEISDVGSQKPILEMVMKVEVYFDKKVAYVKKYKTGELHGDWFGMVFTKGIGDKYETAFSVLAYKSVAILFDKILEDIDKRGRRE